MSSTCALKIKSMFDEEIELACESVCVCVWVLVWVTEKKIKKKVAWGGITPTLNSSGLATLAVILWCCYGDIFPLLISLNFIHPLQMS